MEDNLQNKEGMRTWLVNTFGLTNTPNTFMWLMNVVLVDFLV